MLKGTGVHYKCHKLPVPCLDLVSLVLTDVCQVSVCVSTCLSYIQYWVVVFSLTSQIVNWNVRSFSLSGFKFRGEMVKDILEFNELTEEVISSVLLRMYTFHLLSYVYFDFPPYDIHKLSNLSMKGKSIDKNQSTNKRQKQRKSNGSTHYLWVICSIFFFSETVKTRIFFFLSRGPGST